MLSCRQYEKAHLPSSSSWPLLGWLQRLDARHFCSCSTAGRKSEARAKLAEMPGAKHHHCAHCTSTPGLQMSILTRVKLPWYKYLDKMQWQTAQHLAGFPLLGTEMPLGVRAPGLMCHVTETSQARVD